MIFSSFIRPPSLRHSPLRLAAVLLLQFLLSGPTGLCAEAAERTIPDGNAVIRNRVGDSEIVIRTTERLAGAIDSLTWNGKEFIDSFDHGRQLQSASNFECGGPFFSETFNPTEAGSRDDGAGATSTSRLLHILTTQTELQTTTQMAFWLKPGEESGGHPALNTAALSNHLLTKRVRIGFEDLPHVVEYTVTFSVPIGEFHRYAQFEALTGYMPEEFSEFWEYQSDSGELVPLSSGPGEQPQPVVFSTKDGAHAMGIMTPQVSPPNQPAVGYGRFRFPAAHVVKWNCVFRIRDSQGVTPDDSHFRMFVIIGDLATVRTSLQALHLKFKQS